jgi:GxxExxY protein
MGRKLDLYEEKMTGRIIGAAIEVHKSLGPGLLESSYQMCRAREFSLCEIPFEQEKPLPVEYKGVALDCGYRLDFLVDDKIVVELKSVEMLEPVHEAQLLTYLKLSCKKVGILISFNVSLLKFGIKRLAL